MKVVYNSFSGRYSDNPKALYESLAAGGYPGTHVWLADPRYEQEFPADAETVDFGSERCIKELESADVVVSNTHIELDWNKSADTRYLQTWHGTPLKHIHFDSLWAPPGRVAYLDEDVQRWDYLLSPNRASTGPLRQAFRFPGEIAETGYPRNDVLLGPRRAEIRSAVRRRFGIPPGATVVLYTPTWRDDVLDSGGRQDFSLQLDLADFTRRLGADHYLLLRTHFLISAPLPPIDRPGVRDVSAYPDVCELYLAADVLVTDYSSAMFDFAVTGKPMLFFTYDLEHYRDDLRGFYFDLAEVAPGPLVRTSEELIEAIADRDVAASELADRYARFRDTFCSLEDGHATDRVLDLLFPPGGSAGRPTVERG